MDFLPLYPQVIWRKISDGNVLSVGTYMMVGDGSYSISHRDSRNEWNLVIKNVQLYHAGLYECQISTKEVISKNITLNVIGQKMFFVFSLH